MLLNKEQENMLEAYDLEVVTVAKHYIRPKNTSDVYEGFFDEEITSDTNNKSFIVAVNRVINRQEILLSEQEYKRQCE